MFCFAGNLHYAVMFAVINFTDEGGEKFCCAVPLCWVDVEKNLVKWPKKAKNIKNLIINKFTPTEEWKIFKITKIVTVCGK